jgi:hypothetical protein
MNSTPLIPRQRGTGWQRGEEVEIDRMKLKTIQVIRNKTNDLRVIKVQVRFVHNAGREDLKQGRFLTSFGMTIRYVSKAGVDGGFAAINPCLPR